MSNDLIMLLRCYNYLSNSLIHYRTMPMVCIALYKDDVWNYCNIQQA